MRLLLAHLNQPYEWEEIPSRHGAPRTPEFLAINPNGRVPVLIVEDGTALPESNAILHYLASGTPFLPTGRLEQAQVVQWMCFEQDSHEPNLAVPRLLKRYPDDPRQANLPAMLEAGYRAPEVMEQHLATRMYMVGGTYSVADICLYAYTHLAHEGGYDLERFTAINGWMGRIRSQPGYIGIDAPPGLAG